jgi:hypothetical protein
MPSHASRAAEQLAKDQAERTTSNGTTLKVVPDDPESSGDPGTDLEPPAPPISKGGQARAAMRAALKPWQQEVYDTEIAAGTRHVTALAAARKAPEPDPDTDDIDAEAAKLFAAFAAGQTGAPEPPATVEAATGKPVRPPVPVPDGSMLHSEAEHRANGLQIGAGKPTPKPAAPKPKPAPQPRAPKPAPVASPADGSCERYIGTVTATGLDGVEHTYDCEHGARNGHMDKSTAEGCALRLMRNHPTGTPGTRLHPVRRDRNGRKVTV